VELADGTALKSKGRQHVTAGQRLRLSLPGGGGYGAAEERSREDVLRDLQAGFITPDEARGIYGLDDEE
jgi:N-methylhydantoinase B